MNVTIVPVAHVSEKSRQRVRAVIAEVGPDCVAVELDLRRLQAMLERREPSLRDLAAHPLTALLYLFQKAVGKGLRVTPGEEMLAAVESANKAGVAVALVDRDIGITMARLARIPLSEKLSIAFQMLLAPLAFIPNPFAGGKRIDFDELAEGNGMAAVMREFQGQLPNTYRVLVEERDEHMFHQLLHLRAENVVLVVGAGHAKGIMRRIRSSGGTKAKGELAFKLEPVPSGVAS